MVVRSVAFPAAIALSFYYLVCNRSKIFETIRSLSP